jgi:drug/metabolite transporter (DMT)-like permease
MWILLTLMAATFQILRTSGQHRLATVLTTNAAGYVRYLYAAPVAVMLSAITFGGLNHPIPSIPGRFWLAVTVAGIAQILGTQALLASFKMRDFALGTVYSKTEVIQVAIISMALLSEPLAPLGWVGAVICTAGVIALASKGNLSLILARAGDPAALRGILAGGLFGLTAVCIRAATQSLGDAPTWDRAALTLTILLTIQMLLNGIQLAVQDRGQLIATLRIWRSAIPLGVFSIGGTIGWTLAMTLENAAKVRTLGQVELLIAFAIARISLGERHTAGDYAATALVSLGIVIVAVAG